MRAITDFARMAGSNNCLHGEFLRQIEIDSLR